jgi:hypothetical protein
MVVNCSNVPDEESQQRVALGCDDETVSEDAVGFVFCVGFIAHEKACVLAWVNDMVEGLAETDHVRVNIDTTIFVQDFEAHDVCLALPHGLLIEQVAVDHVLKAGSLLVVPQFVFPEREREREGVSEREINDVNMFDRARGGRGQR